MVLYNDRDVFIGGHVTSEVKDALLAESKRTKASISRLIYESVVAQLRARGHNIESVEDFETSNRRAYHA